MKPSFIKESYTSTNIRIRIIFSHTLKNFSLRQSETQIDNDPSPSGVSFVNVQFLLTFSGYMV